LAEPETFLSDPDPVELRLEPVNTQRFAALCGPCDEYLRLVEKMLGVRLANRGARFLIHGPRAAAKQAAVVLGELYAATARGDLSREQIQRLLQQAGQALKAGYGEGGVHVRRGAVNPRGVHQQAYVAAMRTHTLSFGIGPAGTGKTYLAVACAVEALEAQAVSRLVLVRPAVEAGERLGFLPGDFSQKVDPFLRPIFDALYEMSGFERVGRLIERGVIEIAPLAYMRGRTLNEAFVILDEAQNTTIEQMRMFLTRIGFETRAVVTGDVTQTDLPARTRSGLRHAVEVLREVPGVAFSWFTAKDVVRHPLVASIVEAYEADERNRK